MSGNYGRDIDLNLLRTFAVVAETGSVTLAAARLYLTQPAISAALRRLTERVGAPLFARQGRKLSLTGRGRALAREVALHLPALVGALLSPPVFDPLRDESVFRVGLSDAAELWLLPKLLRDLERTAPRLRVIAVPVQFRNVADALVAGDVQVAVTVADEMPSGIRRASLFHGDFVCLHDPRRLRLPPSRFDERAYFALDHVIVSYNGDLRGIVEDVTGKRRRIRCSSSSFANVGAIVDGSTLMATVPRLVAREVRALRPHLATRELPFALAGAAMELLWPAAADEDPVSRFVRDLIAEIARLEARAASATLRRHPSARGSGPRRRRPPTVGRDR